MKCLFVSMIACMTACAGVQPAPTQTPVLIDIPAPTPTAKWERPGWSMAWHDEFDGDTIDLQNWTYDIGGGGWGNAESEAYTNRSENARIENGILVIEARKEQSGGREYTSARIKTQGLYEWLYGRVEIRAKLPYGQGVWPALWMLGNDIYQKAWPNCGEIDIMEFIGREPDRVYQTLHGPGYSGGNGIGTSFVISGETFRNDFHIYAIEWDPAEIRWYVDEQEVFEVSTDQVPTGSRWVFDHPFFIIINLAIGGRWPGYPDATTVFPQFLYVDYVRVYQEP